jgi:prevent-host-death family protein
LFNLDVKENPLAVDKKRIVKRLPLTDARRHLGEVIRKVRIDKDYFILEKDGIPVAGIMDIDEFEDYLELRDTGVKKQIKKSYDEYRRGKARPARDFLRKIKG